MKKANKQNCLQTNYPELCKEWHPTKNGNLIPKNFTKHSGKKVWWLCKKCNYEWEATINKRTNGRNCPSCSGHIVTEQNCLLSVFPEIAKEWHPTKNGILTPEKVTKCSGQKVWWLCKKCSYEWQININKRTSVHHNCPSCSGKVVTKNNCLQDKYPETAKEWHIIKNKELTPNQVSYGSDKKVWWICRRCKYEWKASISKRTINKRNCPACANQVVTEQNCLLSVFPEIAKEWHPIKNNHIKPNNITSRCGKKFWWICGNCEYEWQAYVSNRAKGNGCPKCAKSRISKSGSQFLDEYNIPIENREYYIKIGKKRFFVDGYDPLTKTIYEYFGNYWHGNPKRFPPQDIHPIRKIPYGQIYNETLDKIKLFEENGYSVIYKWGD